MDRIMLRFRPIAPKPTPGSSSSNHEPKPNRPTTTGSRAKRKSSSSNNNNNNNNKRRNNNKSSTSRSPPDDHHKSNGVEKCHVVTLPLLPETPDLLLSSPTSSSRGDLSRRSSSSPSSSSTWLNFGGCTDDHQAVLMMMTSVVVERVTDTWVDGNNGLGCTDEERRKRLDDDTCPGFISDGWNRVSMTNKAYRRMVMRDDTCHQEGKSGGVVGVRLGVKERVEIPNGKLFDAFTCRVRLQYGNHWISVPCDVWRMDGGGFAWRLDVKTALTLGGL